MAQLCLWTEIRTKQWFDLGASAFHCLFTYPTRSKWASSSFEKMIFFFAKIGILCKSITGPLPSVVQAYTQPYSFGGSIKLIICQIRHELSVTIHEISTSCKKSARWRTLYNMTLDYAYKVCYGDLANYNATKSVKAMRQIEFYQLEWHAARCSQAQDFAVRICSF